MQSERHREAADLRANGQQLAQTIRARAEREATVILAEANRQSEELRGHGDAEKNRILAEAFGLDPRFFTFYRSMQAYEQGLKPGDTRMVLSPDSEFFRYFNSPNGASGAVPGTGAPGGAAGNPSAGPAPAPQSAPRPAPAPPGTLQAAPVQ
jgi:modulator of FtsH protease HflC